MVGERGIFAKYQPRYAEQNVITFPVGPDKKPAIKNWQRLGLEGSAKLAKKFSETDTFGFPLGPRSGLTILDVDTKDESVLHEAQSRYGESPYLWRREAVITPTTDTAASAVISGRGGLAFPLMFSATVMPLVPRQWQPRGNTRSFTARSTILRTSPRFTSCSTSCGSQYRRASAINHCFA